MMNEYQINREFKKLYAYLTKDLKKSHRDHVLGIKKLSNGIKIGVIKLQHNKSGFVLRDTSLKRNNIIYKNILTGRAAVLLAVLHNNYETGELAQVIHLDNKYKKSFYKIEFLKKQVARFSKLSNWIIVDVCLSKIDLERRRLYATQEQIKIMYISYVF
jgi:hypothetical protein